MKKWKIVMPTLIATSAMPLVSLVSCGAINVNLTECEQSRLSMLTEEMALDSGKKYAFSVDMNTWPFIKSPNKYEYFALDILDSLIKPTKKVSIDSKSIKIYIDNKLVNNEELSFEDDGFVYFKTDELKTRILRSRKINGSFKLLSEVKDTPKIEIQGSIEFRGQLKTMDPELWYFGPNVINGTAGESGISQTIIIWYVTEGMVEGVTSDADVSLASTAPEGSVLWEHQADDGWISWNVATAGDYKITLTAAYNDLNLEKTIKLHITAE